MMAVVLLDAPDHGHVALLPQLRLEADLLLVMMVVTVTNLKRYIATSRHVKKVKSEKCSHVGLIFIYLSLSSNFEKFSCKTRFVEAEIQDADGKFKSKVLAFVALTSTMVDQ